MADIFNDYDDQGYRRTVTGAKSSKIEDQAIVRNLRVRWPKELENISDQRLVNEYDEFAMSEMFGNNDENFLAWLEIS